MRDAKAEKFSMPFFQMNKALGLRMFSQLCSDPQGQVSRYPEDYALFELGEFDDETGLMTALPQPLHLANALDFKSDDAQVTRM